MSEYCRVEDFPLSVFIFSFSLVANFRVFHFVMRVQIGDVSSLFLFMILHVPHKNVRVGPGNVEAIKLLSNSKPILHFA